MMYQNILISDFPIIIILIFTVIYIIVSLVTQISMNFGHTLS